MRQKLMWTGAAIILVAIVFAVVLPESTPPRSEPTATITVGLQGNTVAAPFYVAEAQGFFEKAGLRVKLKPYPSGKLALNAMLAGEVDLATCADMPIAVNTMKGESLALYCTFAEADNAAWLIARTDRGILKPTDLRGKTIGTQEGSAVHFFLSLFLLHHRIADDEVQIRFMKAVDLPQALADGRIDAFSMRNPFIRIARNLLPDTTVEFRAPGIYRQTFNLVGRRSPALPQEHIAATIRAVRDATDTIQQQPDAMCALVARALGANGAEAIEQDWRSFRFALSLQHALILTLEDQVRWARRQRPEAQLQPQPNFMRILSPEPLTEIAPESVRLLTLPERTP